MSIDPQVKSAAPVTNPARPPRSMATIVSQALVFVFAGGLIALVSIRLLSTAPGQATGAGNAAPTDTIPWLTNYDDALAQSAKTGKPVLLDFSASWCPPCQKMRKDSWPDPRIEQIVKSKYIPVLMDADKKESAKPSQRYGIQFIPAVLVVDSNGAVIRQGDFMSADELLEFLKTNGSPLH